MTREILIANTKTQTRTKLETEATTLRELKAAMDAANIDYSGMTFTEGISKTQLISDDTQLPQNVMYKGQPTNNLVILLTNTKNKVASGASRAALYAAIKERNLQGEVLSRFGRNFTQVSTNDLQNILSEYSNRQAEPSKPAVTQKEAPASYSTSEPIGKAVKGMLDSVGVICQCLADKGIFGTIDLTEIEYAVDLLGSVLTDLANDAFQKSNTKPVETVSSSDGTITSTDIDAMINSLA